MVHACLRIRVPQHLDATQSVHAVPSPFPLAPSAVSNATPRVVPHVRVSASYIDAASAGGDVQTSPAELVPRREIDAVAKASGSSAPYVLGRKYSKHVIAHAQAGDHVGAWILFSKLREYDAKLQYSCYHHVMVACLKAHERKRALDAYHAITEDGKQSNPPTTCQLISGLLRGSRKQAAEFIPSALEVWRNFVHREGIHSMDPYSLRAGVHVLCRAGKPGEAQQMIDDMRARGIDPGVEAYNMLICGHAQAGDIAGASAVLESMALKGLPPNRSSYNTLISCLCRAGEAQQAQHVVSMAERRGIQLDEWAWSAVIQVHIEAKQLPAVRAVMREMRNHGVKLGPVTVCQLLKSCELEASQVAAKAAAVAVWKLVLVTQAELSAECYNTMLSIVLRGDPDFVAHAMEAMSEMRTRGLRPRTDTFNTIMQAAIDNADFLQAVTLFQQLEAEGLQPDAKSYTIVMKAFQEAGQLGRAQRAYSLAAAAGHANIVATNALVDVLVDAQRLQDASRVVQTLQRRMVQGGGDVKEILPGFGALIVGYARQKRCAEAVELLRRFNSIGGVPDKFMLETVLTSCLATGEVTFAKQVVRAMQLSGSGVDTAFYERIIDDQLERAASNDAPIRRTVALERFKFWLGVPNSYYNADD
eukprot:jgi/Ulvmu1/6445/UM003_0075.1